MSAAIQENVGMALLRRASLEDDNLIQGCCPLCHSADVTQLRSYRAGEDFLCNNCGQYIGDWQLQTCSHLADVLKHYSDPEKKIERHEVVALVNHAAHLHMQLREAKELLKLTRNQLTEALSLELSPREVVEMAQ